MEAPRRKHGRGVGKAPESPWSCRVEGPFMPQARRASLLGRRAEVHLENNRSLRRSGGQRGGAVDVPPLAFDVRIG